MRRKTLLRNMDRGAKLWLYKYARRNFWRVSCWYELDDLIQDGHMHYQRILDKYPRVANPAHLMRLFQITFANHLNDLSKFKTRAAEIPVGLEGTSELYCVDGWAEVLRVIIEAPPEIRRALEILVLKPGAISDTSKRLGSNLMAAVHEYLSNPEYVGGKVPPIEHSSQAL